LSTLTRLFVVRFLKAPPAQPPRPINATSNKPTTTAAIFHRRGVALGTSSGRPSSEEVRRPVSIGNSSGTCDRSTEPASEDRVRASVGAMLPATMAFVDPNGTNDAEDRDLSPGASRAVAWLSSGRLDRENPLPIEEGSLVLPSHECSPEAEGRDSPMPPRVGLSKTLSSFSTSAGV